MSLARYAPVRLMSAITACILLIALADNECLGEEFHNAISLQGFTGILNTPNAALTNEGHVYSLYSNQKENSLRPQLSHEDSYMFSIGMFDLLEVGGRLTDGTYHYKNPGLMDLSANFKLQVPFIPRGEYIPQLAVGVQDLGGGAHNLRTVYGIASEELWRFRFSAGVGSGPDRMKGAFGGVEAKAFDWLYLLAEYDTRETNVGLRLVTPEMFGIPVNLQVTVKSALNYKQGSPELGFGFQVPLGLDHYNRQPLTKAVEPVQEKGVAEYRAGEAPQSRDEPATGSSSQPTVKRRAELLRLRDRLAREGFQYVRVGEGEDGLLIVEYENGRYTSNELDGMGIVAGITAEMAPAELDNLRLVLRKKGIGIFQVTAPISGVKAFMADASGIEKLRDTIQATPELTDDSGVRFVSDAVNPAWLRPSLVLYPELKTFIGTEVSAADYLLSLRPDLYLPVWKGAVANIRWDIPLIWSDGFDDGQPFRGSRTPSRMDRLMLFQALRLAPTLMANIGAGMIVHDSNGTLNELLWQPGNGSHRLRFRQAFAVDSQTHDRTEVYLGAYRYRYAPLDLSLEATAGRFFSKDTGFTVELKRFFGDTAFSIYYKNVRSADDERIQAGGVQLSFPLTLRREMNPSPVQLKGSDEWNYAQETEIVSHGPNQVGRAIAVNPQPAYNLATVFYNRDRLSESYLKLHLLRLRDAYLRYGLNE
jgi:Exopolysaccharide biosynthesis protein YbjH